MDKWKKNMVAGFGIGLLVILLVSPFVFFNPLEGVHLRLSNLLYRGNHSSADIVLIAIDEKSLDPQYGLGSYREWPRSYFAQVIRKLKKYNPEVIALDFDYSNPSKNLSFLRIQELLSAADNGEKVNFYLLLKALSESGEHPDDAFLLQELKGTKNAVLATTEKIYEQEGKYVAEHEVHPIFSSKNILEGFAFILADQDEQVRKFLREIISFDTKEGRNSFAFQTARAFSPAIAPFWENAKDPSLIYFPSPPGRFERISFVDAMAGKFEESQIKGKIVMIGATASILKDIRKTPISKIPMPGVEIQANIVQQLLEKKVLLEQTAWAQFLMIAVAVIIGSILVVNIPLLWGTLLFIFYLIVFGFAANIAFRNFGADGHAALFNLINPPIAFLFMYVGGLWYHNETELREKRETKRAFAHYVNEEVASEILKHPEKLKLGGEKKMLSVLFTDIISFTSLAEKLSPEDLVGILNEYLDVMSNELLKNGATVDKFEGDAIMAFFGAPIPHEDYVMRACISALQMRIALQPLHEKWHRENKPLLDFCVGISTGQAIVGNFGSKDRFDYTVIGDTVNLGARLESANRLYGTKILTDESTMKMVPQEAFVWRKIDRIRVKGKAHPVTIYELVGYPQYLSDTGRAWLSDFENGIKLYEKRDFEKAEKYFSAAQKSMPGDGPASMYMNRCRFLSKNPPPDAWDFVVDLESK